jgi:hypothetical protein
METLNIVQTWSLDLCKITSTLFLHNENGTLAIMHTVVTDAPKKQPTATNKAMVNTRHKPVSVS